MRQIKKILFTACVWVIAMTAVAQNKGYALLIGATKTFDFSRFNAASVVKADKDADLINTMLISSGFQAQDIKLLKGADATVSNVVNDLTDFSKKAKKGDMFVFYFSGHGDTIADANHDELPYTFDQRIILADGAVVDDILFDIFSKFKDSVRIVFIADACFSGHMYQFDVMYARERRNAGTTTAQMLETDNAAECFVRKDSAKFNMMYVGAVDRDATAIPIADGSGKLTSWIYNTWEYLKLTGILETQSMLEFFRQACASDEKNIISMISPGGKNIFGKSYLFKL